MTALPPGNAGPSAAADVLERIEFFPALQEIDVCRHAFVRRIPGIEVTQDKTEALCRLDSAHRQIRHSLGWAARPLISAQQVHGDRVEIIESPPTSDFHLDGCDGFITRQRGIVLGIYVADCCAVYVVDRNLPAIGLVHSGKKGSALGIARRAIDLMRESFGSEPSNMIVQLSPCIRPPHYEIDFAAAIREQCRAAGVKQVYDNGVCTACDLESYYSYRAEKGKTGRMLALLALI